MTDPEDLLEWPFRIDFEQGIYEVDVDAWVKWLKKLGPHDAAPAFDRLLMFGCERNRLVYLLSEVQLCYHNPNFSLKDYRALFAAVKAITDLFEQDPFRLWRLERSHQRNLILDGVGEDLFERLFRLRDNLERARPFVGGHAKGAEEQAIFAVCDYVSGATGQWRNEDVSSVLSAILNQELSSEALTMRRYRREQ